MSIKSNGLAGHLNDTIIRATFALVPLLVFAYCGACHGDSKIKELSQTVPVIEPSNAAISIEGALKSPDLTEKQKDKIRLIQEVKTFAESELYLYKTNNYTTYLPNVKGIPAWVVNAVPKDSLNPYLWSNEKSPYSTYDDKAEAEEERRRLEGLGYETTLWQANGYSSSVIGLSDPIWPAMLEYDDLKLITTIIHELAHATLYRHQAANFSESFAVFLEEQGGMKFLVRRYGSAGSEVRRMEGWLVEIHLHSAFVRMTADRLRLLYASKPKNVLEERERVFAAIREKYKRAIKVNRSRPLLTLVDNASIIEWLPYTYSAAFEPAFANLDGDWLSFVTACQIAILGNNPFQRLNNLAQKK